MRLGAVDIVHKETELAHARVVELFKLCNHLVVFRGVAQVDIQSGMDCPDKFHLGFPALFDELLELGKLRIRVEFAPFVAVVGIVLRTIDIGVHFKPLAEVHQALPVLMAPGRSVEALDEAAELGIRPVGDGELAHLLRIGGKNLVQRRHAVEDRVGTVTEKGDYARVLRRDVQQIGVLLLRQQLALLRVTGTIEVGCVACARHAQQQAGCAGFRLPGILRVNPILRKDLLQIRAGGLVHRVADNDVEPL